MFRIIITYIVPLILPTVMFFIWSAWVQRKIKREHANSEEAIEAFEISTPWFRLILTGLGLMIVGLLLSVLLGPKNPPDSVYQAPRIENGKIMPGKYAPK